MRLDLFPKQAPIDRRIEADPAESEAMSTTPYSRQALVRTLDEAGWPVVADRVIRGICHDLNGRINSLTSLSYLLSTGSGEWAKVGPVVEEELKRAEELSRFLRVLPDDEPGAQVLALNEFLPRALRLVSLQPGFENVRWEDEIPSDFPAVRMDEALLLRCLCLLLTGVAEGRDGARIGIRGSAETRTLTVEPGELRSQAESGPGPGGEWKRVPDNMGLLVAGVIQELGGALVPMRAPDGGLVLEFRLPGLGG